LDPSAAIDNSGVYCIYSDLQRLCPPYLWLVVAAPMGQRPNNTLHIKLQRSAHRRCGQPRPARV